MCRRSSKMHGNGGNKLKGVRRRKWGKWVSEIRVPGSQERLWLGTYATAEAAAVAHDVAVYCLRRPSSLEKLNFPDTLSSYSVPLRDMSPRSVQKVASDVAMDVDAKNIVARSSVVAPDMTYQIDAGATHLSDALSCFDAWGYDESATLQPSVVGQDWRVGENLSISIEDYL
ncbi:hypothetical protein Fmac_001288 [Flemingia macrophylla]|uniref:AP2/ERF domain-containing protein n=1 Tax=Flemingia macrophylla TaxID=520843 RepID=A0ABD1NHF0_9FABA